MNNKRVYNGEVLLFPCPTVLVSSKLQDRDNVLTVSWAGIASSHPEYVTIAINKKRLSYSYIFKTRKFCINIPDSSMIQKVDYCGSFSGREKDKFFECGFSKSYYNDYVIIDDCPMQILCEVESILSLGSHDLFVGKVVQKFVNDSITDFHTNISPIIYFRPNYYTIHNEKIGYYGFSKNVTDKNSPDI